MNDKELEKIEKIIESCHINFMIGSGASRDYLETLNNIEELLTKLEGENSTEVLETSIKYEYFDKCIRGNLRLLSNISVKKEIDYQNTKNNYNEFIKALNIVLLKRKTSLLNRQVNLFTTNMDLFLDKTLDESGVEFNDGFSGKFEPVFSTSNYQKTFFKSSAQYDFKSELPLFNLFKLHGSVTWKQVKEGSDEVKIIYDSSLQTLKKLDEIKFNKKNEIVSNITDFDIAKKQVIELEVKSLENHFKFLKEYKDLVMINPNKEKFESTTLRLEYYEQLRMYSNALEKENSVLFVCGFSFADEHIKQITLRVANSNPTLIVYVFCFNDKAKNDIEDKLGESKFNNLNCIVLGDFSNVIKNVFGKIASRLDSKSYQLNQGEYELIKIKNKPNNNDEEAKQ
ncbi:hypothetical protein AAGV28_03510 [Flavobacterium sp. FZUC8N2.13]|uniref:SIR2-like domain-containing protein n=1 Tax=Flavobacterium zubiriense TaxID=3138075 RepID=A0ABV4TBW8_9FLAO